MEFVLFKFSRDKNAFAYKQPILKMYANYNNSIENGAQWMVYNVLAIQNILASMAKKKIKNSITLRQFLYTLNK